MKPWFPSEKKSKTVKKIPGKTRTNVFVLWIQRFPRLKKKKKQAKTMIFHGFSPVKVLGAPPGS